jgi:ABC-type proline/glycine betaine transport system permease subunit
MRLTRQRIYSWLPNASEAGALGFGAGISIGIATGHFVLSLIPGIALAILAALANAALKQIVRYLLLHE